jgi:hypothetical protein
VLRVHGGGDHFVSVSGRYLPSSWGLRNSKLAAFTEPVWLIPSLDKLETLQTRDGSDDTEGPVQNVVKEPIMKEVAMLLDFLMQPEQAGGANLLATKVGDAAKVRSPQNEERLEETEAVVAAVRESLDTGAFPPLNGL